jgi:hypothetical protein
MLAQEWKWTEAEEEFRVSLRLGDLHTAQRQFAQFLLVRSRFGEAWKHLQIAEEMDPFSARQQTSTARFFYYSRWHREAKEYYATKAQHGRPSLEVKVIHALTQIQMGEQRMALGLAEEIRKAVVGESPVYLALVAEILALCDDVDAARSLVASADLLGKDVPISSFRKACLALALKNRTEGLRFLNESWQRKEPELPWLAADPRLDGIRGEDQYLTILRAVFHDG